jgi:hypothetical protein
VDIVTKNRQRIRCEVLTDSGQTVEGSSGHKYIYNSTGNMAILIDGVDEVSPHYTKKF